MIAFATGAEKAAWRIIFAQAAGRFDGGEVDKREAIETEHENVGGRGNVCIDTHKYLTVDTHADKKLSNHST